MSKRTFWRFFTTILICLGCAYFFVPLSKVRLGLDLRGGAHYELEIQGSEALDSDLRDNKDRFQDKLRDRGLPNAMLIVDKGALRVDGVDASQKDLVGKIISGLSNGYSVQDDGGVLHLVQRSDYQKSLIDDAGKRAMQIIENRINQFGVAEPEITRAGAEGTRIVVELPGVDVGDRERIKGLLSAPGHLEQRLLGNPADKAIYFPTKEAALQHYNGTIPPQFELFPDIEVPHGTKKPENVKPGEEPVQRWVLVESRQGLDGADIIDANRSQDPNTGSNEVNFTLNKKGADAFAALTGIASDQNRLMAIILDHRIISVLSAREKIFGGAVRISGSFSPQEADDLALSLRSGAMKASMHFLEQSEVEASLGRDSIHAGVRASLIGFLTIIAFMVLYYKWSGFNAIVALTVNLIVMLGLLGSFHATLTLPGIAGFALTIGMAVDANILIFERIREELDHGKSVPGAIDAGFDHVFWTIVDAHVTQLVAALLLFSFGTGPVKGFAVALAVGVSASLFTSIYVSRFIYDWILERHPGTKTLSV
ncbi:MAG TPA: protein translocase subunit SecD [Holophagaceae bacterium]|jgi:protein-export membrane protein SecD|nr:protein translocase subunit SecD [Holophagaceae bacterium]